MSTVEHRVTTEIATTPQRLHLVLRGPSIETRVDDLSGRIGVAAGAGAARVEKTPAKPILDQVVDLLESMAASDLFSETLSADIDNWAESCLGFFSSLESEKARRRGGFALFLLLRVVVYGAIEKEGDPEKQVKFLGFEDVIRELLKSTLGESFSDEKFLVECNQRKDCIEEDKMQIGVLIKLFEENMERLRENGNLVNDMILDSFNRLKTRLTLVNRNRDLITADLHAKIDSLHAGVVEVHSSLEKVAKKVLVTTEQLAASDDRIEETMKRAMGMLCKLAHVGGT